MIEVVPGAVVYNRRWRRWWRQWLRGDGSIRRQQFSPYMSGTVQQDLGESVLVLTFKGVNTVRHIEEWPKDRLRVNLPPVVRIGPQHGFDLV